MNLIQARPFLRRAITWVAFLAWASPGKAQTTGFNQTGGGPFDYNNTGNWVGGTINGIWDSSLTTTAAQTVTFGANTTLTTPLLIGYNADSGTGNARNLTLRADGTGPYTLTLGGDITVSTVINETITLGSSTGNQNLHVNLGGVTRTFTTLSRTLAFRNIVSNGGIIANGGQVNFYSANSYSGDTTITSGNVALQGASGSSVNSDFFIKGGGASLSQLQINGAGETSAGTTRAKSVTIDGSGTTSGAFLTVTGNSSNNSVDTIANALTASAGLVTVGVSAHSTRAAQLTAATFTRSAGASVLFRGSDLGVNTIASLTVGDANIFFGSAPTLTGGGGAVDTSTISIIPGAFGDTTSNGTGSSGGLVTYDATYGVRRLNTATEYTATIADGQTQLDNVRLARVSGGASQDVALTATTTTLNSLTFHVSGSGTNSGITISGSPGTTLKLDSGTIFASQLVTTATASDAMTISVPTLDLNGQEGLISVFTTGVSNGNTSAPLYISSVIANDGGNGVTFSGTGQTHLNGTAVNSYTGVTTLNSGILRLNRTGAGQNAIPGDLVINGGSLLKNSDSIADTSNVTINGGAIFLDSTTSSGNNGGTETINSLTMNGGGLATSGGAGANLIISGDLTMNASQLRMNRGGDITVGGNTVLNGGVLVVRHSGVNNPGTATTVNAFVTLNTLDIINPASGSYKAISFEGNATNREGMLVMNGDVTFTGNGTNSNTVSLDHSDPNLTFLNVIALNGTRTFNIGNGAADADLTIVPSIVNGASAGGLTKTGLGTLLLQGASSYTGPTTVNAGILRIDGGNDRVSTASSLAVNGGASAAAAGTFDLNGYNQAVAGLNGTAGAFAGTITNDSGAPGTAVLTVTGGGTFAGTIQDGATAGIALVKSTGGTQTLTGDNTYSGTTIVTGGTLALSGGSNVSPSFVIASGGGFTQSGTDWTTDLFQVSGTGSIIEIAQLADSADGDSVLTYVIGVGGTSAIDLQGANPFAQYDAVVATGMDLWANEWTVNLAPTGGINSEAWQPTFTLMSGFDLTALSGKLNVTAYLSSGASHTFENVVHGDQIYLSSLATSIAKYQVRYTSEGLELVFDSSRAIPEPSTFGLVALALALLRWRSRSFVFRA